VTLEQYQSQSIVDLCANEKTDPVDVRERELRNTQQDVTKAKGGNPEWAVNDPGPAFRCK
jgi:hypothetical protein